MITATGQLVCKDLDYALQRFEREDNGLSLLCCLERIPRNTAEQIGAVAALMLCNRLVLADLSKSGRCMTIARMLQDEFIKTFPTSFPLVALKMGGATLELPQYRLTVQSRKFERMFDSPLNEKHTSEVTLLPLDMPSTEAIVSFLRYLQTGFLEITDDTCLDLFLLAEENDLPNLSSRVIERLRGLIDRTVLKEWLELAVLRNYTALKYICVEFATKGSFEQELTSIINTTEQPEVAEILTIAMVLRKSSVVLGKHGIGSISFLNIGFIRDIKKLALIQKLHHLTPLCRLQIASSACLDQHLQTLSQFIKAPEQLFLSDTSVSSIPENWLGTLSTIEAKKCQSLKKVISETALDVKLTFCSSLS